MIAKKIRAAALGFSYAALGLTPAAADDTDIFFGGVSSEVVKPNVLFILDNSTSMTNSVGNGNYTSRMQTMKNAFNNILGNVQGVNVGLMRFNDPGGSIMFPVTDIDAEYWGDSTSVPAIDQSGDDANESLFSGGGDGSVNLTNDYLGFGFFPTSISEVQVRVSNNYDDAEERSNGYMELGGSYWNIQSGQTNGVRFRNVAIPQNASIDSASITFTANQDDSDALNIRLYGHSSVNAPVFGSSYDDISSRTKTANHVLWTPDDWDVNQTYVSPDLSPIVQEIIANASWESGNSLAFIQTYEDGGGGDRSAYTHENNASKAALLNVTYHAGDDPVIAQATGLRFQNVGIPQGATVTNAYIEFTPKTSSIPGESLTLDIQIEDSGDAGEFTTATSDISAATYLTSVVSWEAGDWVEEETVNSPDLTSLVQQIVSENTWCGGNAMAFRIKPASGSAAGKRVAYSYDEGTSKQPRLVVEYDKSSVPDGACQQIIIRRQIATQADDAEQMSGGGVDNDGQYFNMTDSQTNGLRFEDLPLKPDAEIIEAHLIFTARETENGSATVTLEVQDALNPVNFSETSNNISGRDKLDNAAITWNSASSPGLTDWTANNLYTTPDISALIQPLVNKDGWNSGENAIVFIQTLSGSERTAYTWDSLPGGAVALEVKVKTSDVDGAASGTTVRDHLISLVEQMEPKTWTPIVDSLYEAARYYRGDPVYWGREREHDGVTSSTDDRWKRVSHMNSLTGGTRYFPPGCSEDDLDSSSCSDEEITGSPVYRSPITEACQANYIVLLTDGQANHNNSASLIKDYIDHSGDCSNSNSSEACSEELVQWLADEENDHAPGINGKNTVQTFTIAFALSDTGAQNYLEGLAQQGKGKFLRAGSEGELTNAFNEILQEILETDSTFVVPGTTISQFNLLTNDEDVYFAVFKPSTLPRWLGNLKKYKIATSGDNINEFVGQGDELAVDPETGFFDDDVKSFWTDSSGADDGANVELGGAALELPAPGSRKAYTYYSGGSTSIKDNPLSTGNTAITTTLLGIDGKANPDTYRTNLLNWTRGADVMDTDSDGNTTEARHEMGDPLHSAPVTIFYGGTQDAPDFTVYMTTNEGYLHAFDADTGEELFAFMPEEVLPNLATLYDNAKTDKHPYGLDGAITKWVHDANQDGDIEADDGDHAYIYFGMRRGGDHYYALDVTDRTNPKLMWILDGGVSPYAEMGQSWADPVKARVSYDNGTAVVVKDVLLISGGYDPDQDTHAVRTVDDEGRAIFMVEAGYPGGHPTTVTPASIWSAGNGVNHKLNLSEMKYSISGSVKAGDVDGDGLVDIMFAADQGGQIWRFDVDNGAPLNSLVTGGRIADLANVDVLTEEAAIIANSRRFHADVDATTYIQSSQRALALTIGSGWRANPLSETVDDRFYMLKQSFAKPANYTVLKEGDLYNATANLAGSADADTRNQAHIDLKAASGWYIKLEGDGEKVLAQSYTLQSQVFFTAYEPNPSSTQCNAAAGTSYLYGVNLYDATPLFEVGDEKTRRLELASGNISPQPTLIITPNGKPRIAIAAELEDPPEAELVKKTYWFQPK